MSEAPIIDVAHVGCGGSVDVLPTVPYVYAGSAGLRQKTMEPLSQVYYTFRCRKCGLSGGQRPAIEAGVKRDG